MAKNEADHVDRFVETTQGADYVVVTDTGSTDGTQERLTAAGVTVVPARIMPWRFDTATNVALCNVPEDTDLCIKLDLDEVLFTHSGNHWRDELERKWQDGIAQQFLYWYTWKWAVPGKVPAVRFRTGNIHDRSGFHWRHPGHAALTSFNKSTQVLALEDIEIHHYMVSKARPNYISLLELAVAECECPRTLFYLGREYFFRRMDLKSAETLTKYLEHPKSHWKAERAEAMRMLGDVYARTNAPNQALSWLMRATAEYPGTREIWFALTRYFSDQKDFEGAKWAGSKALLVVDRDPGFTTNDGAAWGPDPFLITAQACIETGDNDKARALVLKALELDPQNKKGLAILHRWDGAA